MTYRFYTALGLGVVHGVLIGLLIALALGLLGCTSEQPAPQDASTETDIQAILAMETPTERMHRLDRTMQARYRDAFRHWSLGETQAGANAYTDAALLEHEITATYGNIWGLNSPHHISVKEAKVTYADDATALRGIVTGLQSLADCLKEESK